MDTSTSAAERRKGTCERRHVAKSCVDMLPVGSPRGDTLAEIPDQERLFIYWTPCRYKRPLLRGVNVTVERRRRQRPSPTTATKPHRAHLRAAPHLPDGTASDTTSFLSFFHSICSSSAFVPGLLHLDVGVCSGCVPACGLTSDVIPAYDEI